MKVIENNIVYGVNPNTDDIGKPNFRIVWISKKSNKEGESLFFSFGNGIDFVVTLFNTVFPDLEIIDIRNINN